MNRDIIVIGGSAGAVDPLMHIAANLPEGMRASVFVVLHTSPRSKGELSGFIDKVSKLRCGLAVDGEPIRQGRIYFARPDFHLLVEGEKVAVKHGPKENFSRPALDPLFRSVAAAFGRRVIGVMLSGLLDDGAAGLVAIKKAGGIAVVQSPASARHPSMPRSAIAATDVDYVTDVTEIAPLLATLVNQPVEPPAINPSANEGEVAEVAAGHILSEEGMRRRGVPSVFTCPDCGGVLFEFKDGRPLRFRCSIGHAYGAQSLFAGKKEGVEEALSASYRALQESERLARRLMESLALPEFPMTIQELKAKADAAARNAEVIRSMLTENSFEG